MIFTEAFLKQQQRYLKIIIYIYYLFIIINYMTFTPVPCEMPLEFFYLIMEKLVYYNYEFESF